MQSKTTSRDWASCCFARYARARHPRARDGVRSKRVVPALRPPPIVPAPLASSHRGGNSRRLLSRRAGIEPVDEFIEALPAKRAAKIDDYIEEYLNGRPPDAPPPEYPISSQIEGELRELRVRFANARYRVLYQRSDNLVVLLHAIEKDTGAVQRATSNCEAADGRLPGPHGRQAENPAKRRRQRCSAEAQTPCLTELIEIDKLSA